MTTSTQSSDSAEQDARRKRAEERQKRIVATRSHGFAEAEEWDLAYWQSKTPQERLTAYMAIREDVKKVMEAKRRYAGSS